MAGIEFDLSKQPAPTVLPFYHQAEPNAWNKSVIESSIETGTKNQAKPFDAVKQNEARVKTEEVRVKLENMSKDSTWFQEFKGIGGSFQQTNDFVALDKYINRPEFKPDEEWMNTVSNFKNVSQLLDSEGLSTDSATKISKTKSFDEYTYMVGVLKHEAEVNTEISNHTSGLGKFVGGTAGALLGLDLPAMLLPFVGEARILKKIDNIANIYDAQKAANAIEAHKLIMTASNISLTAAATVGHQLINDDTSLTQSLLGFVALAGINQHILNKSFRNMDNIHQNIMGHLQSSDELFKINPQLQIGSDRAGFLLPYTPMEGEPIISGMRSTGKPTMYMHPEGTGMIGTTPVYRLPNILRETSQFWSSTPIEMGMRSTGKGIIHLPSDMKLIAQGASSDLVKGNLELIQKEISLTTKSIAQLETRLSSGGMGKELTASTTKAMDIAKEKLGMLQTGFNKVKKAGSYDSSMAEIAKISKANGLTEIHKALAESVLDVIPNSIKAIEKHIDENDIKDIAKTVVNTEAGERIAFKTVSGEVRAGIKNKDGKFIAFAKQHKALTVMTAAVLGAANASAFSGDSTTGDTKYVDYAVYALLAFMGGSIALNKLQKVMNKTRGFNNVASQVVKDVASTIINKEMSMTPAGEEIGKFYSAYNKSLVAMGYPFRALFYKGNEAGKKLAVDLFYDPENTMPSTAEILRHQKVNNGLLAIKTVYIPALKLYMAESRQAYSDATDYIRKAGKARNEFNLAIAYAIENKSLDVHPQIRKVAEAQRAGYQDMIQRAVAAGVAGMRALDDTYFPRITKYSQYYQLANHIDSGFSVGTNVYDETFNNYRRMYQAEHLSATAAELDAVAKQFTDGIADASNRNIIGGVGDILGSPTARAMERIPLDLTKWKPIDVIINGERTTLTIDSLFNRDAESVYESYMSSMEGHIALAQKGYKSFTEATNIAGAQADDDIARIATIGINRIIGVSNFDSTSTIAQSSKIVSNASMFIALSGSAIMQIKEVGGSVIRASKSYPHFKVLISELANVLRNRGSDDAITALAMELDGRGSGVMTTKFHTRAFDDGVENMFSNDSSILNLVNSAGIKARDASMIIYGIAPLTDWAQRFNARFNFDKIARVAFGFEKLSKTEIEAYGITEEFLSLARSVLKVNKKGYVTAESVKAVEDNPKTYEELQRVIFNMGQTQMATPTIGTTPAFFHESAMGSAMGNIMSFTFNAYAIYGANSVKGLSRVDPAEIIDTVMWFAMMMVAQDLKDIKNGKDRTDEEKLRMALANMPLAAPVALPSLLGGSDIQNNTATLLSQHAQTMATLGVAFE